MITFLNLLEVRMYKPQEIIVDELSECDEMLFVESGVYSVGYLINNKIKIRKRFGATTVIGGF